jgi:hypothetical protein
MLRCRADEVIEQDLRPSGEAEMKPSIALSVVLLAGFLAASTETAGAVVYCQYAEYPAGCVLRPVVVVPGRGVRTVRPSTEFLPSGILRQDLFDRNNPNNLRSDWPSPPAQPGQF